MKTDEIRDLIKFYRDIRVISNKLRDKCIFTRDQSFYKSNCDAEFNTLSEDLMKIWKSLTKLEYGILTKLATETNMLDLLEEKLSV